jgi:UDP-N-acetylglucosamine--N-acetylmuramyl-(pentapeptide) pyrophosphoryl-undecaprenol N-acetylglucosamine transferase
MAKLPEAHVLHAAGPAQFDQTLARVAELALHNYEVKPYLESAAMAKGYAEADIVIARSGGTLAELAMFGLPSILVPLPTSADDHQLHNAEEFAAMNAATVLRQTNGRGDVPVASPQSIAEAVASWLGDGEKRNSARKNLHEWDIPDATERIVKLIEAAT